MCEICKSLHELPWRLLSDECSTLLVMMNDIGIGKKQQLYVIKKMINIAIRATYYIFCCRNRNWDSPDLMQFWFLFFSFFFLFLFFCVFWIIQSQAAFVNLFTIVHSKTQIKFLLLLLLLFSFFRCLMRRLPISQFFLEKIVLKWNVTLLNMRNQNCTLEAVLLISHTLTTTTTTTTTKQIS